MTQPAENLHQITGWNRSKTNGLPGKRQAASADFKTFIIHGRAHIAHSEIARIFDLNPSLIAGMLDEFQWEEGQGDTVFYANRTFYADQHSFYALSSSLDLDEALMQAVLLSLGHFQEMAP